MKIKWHRTFFYGVLVSIAFVVRKLPLNWVSKIGSSLGLLLYSVLKHERKKALTHLQIALGKSKSPEEIRQIARRTFANLGRNACEWLKMPSLSNEAIKERVDVENMQAIETALARGKGVIVLTGHYGNWEWLAAYFGCLGYHGGVLARRIYFEPYNRLLVSMRLAHRVETIYRDDSPKKILKMLAQNHILGILPDQDVDKINGIFVPFFGKEAYTPTGPVALALASGAALIPAFMIRKGDRFRLVIENPIEVKKTGNKDEDLRRHTLEWNNVLQQYIEENPDHWVWIHRRWKTKLQTADKG